MDKDMVVDRGKVARLAELVDLAEGKRREASSKRHYAEQGRGMALAAGGGGGYSGYEQDMKVAAGLDAEAAEAEEKAWALGAELEASLNALHDDPVHYRHYNAGDELDGLVAAARLEINRRKSDAETAEREERMKAELADRSRIMRERAAARAAGAVRQ